MKEIIQRITPVGIFGVRKQLNLVISLLYQVVPWASGMSNLAAALMLGFRTNQLKIRTLEARIVELETRLGVTTPSEGDGEDSRTDGSEGRAD